MRQWLVYYNGTHFQDRGDVIPFPIYSNHLAIWSLVMHGLATSMCSIVIASILWSKKTQVQGFNLYLIFNLVPDLWCNLYKFITRLFKFGLGVPLDSYPYPCLIGTITIVSYVLMNLWVNALAVYEVYQMLQYTHQCRRFNPTPSGVIIRRVFIIYGASVIAAILLTLNTKPFLDIRIHPDSCTPSSYGIQSCAIAYTLLVLFTVIPWSFIIYVVLKIRKNSLLPSSGKCRFLALYFLCIAFVASTITTTVIVTKATKKSVEFLIVLSAQSILVSLMSMKKKDIHDAVFDTCFSLCRSNEKRNEISETKSNHVKKNCPESPFMTEN